MDFTKEKLQWVIDEMQDEDHGLSDEQIIILFQDALQRIMQLESKLEQAQMNAGYAESKAANEAEMKELAMYEAETGGV